jgi:beta-glucosidase
LRGISGVVLIAKQTFEHLGIRIGYGLLAGVALVLVFARSLAGADLASTVIEPVPRPGDAVLRQKITGTNFGLSVPNIGPGEYTVEFGFMETDFTNAGQRIFGIFSAGHTLATNLDVFSAAGGAGKPWFLKIPVEHSGDLTGGPLTFRFISRTNSAMVSTFDLRNASGQSVFFFSAADMMNNEDPGALKVPDVPGPELWKDPAQPLETRLRDLVSRMSLVEKVAQLRNGAPPITRLGLPAYDYWNECLHGVGRAGEATVFPQAIGMAATWDEPLIHQVADTIATEARAKHNLYALLHEGDSAKYIGLTFWTPNINLFRDPRWGRGQETYGEDPLLTARLGVAFIRGLQGDDPKYIKAMACAKHFAVHSGPESSRHWFNAAPPERDLYESYLPQFEAAVREGRVGTVMGAYNRLYGEPACSNPLLLTDLLRRQWGFDGQVVSDCGAIEDIYAGHKVVDTPVEAAARALNAGCDLCCGTNFNILTRAVKMGMVSEHDVDVAARRVLAARFRLGLFDPPQMVSYAQIPIAQNDSPENENLALRTARESIVLLKNDGLLPLNRTKVKRIAVIGANANSVAMLLGNYNGQPSNPVTILQGIREIAGRGIEVVYEPGCPLALRNGGTTDAFTNAWSQALDAAKWAEVILYIGGISPQLEGEEMPVDYDGFSGGDRSRIELPALQTDLLKALHATGKPVVFVNCSGSAIAMPWEAKNLPAIIQAWYPGEQGGRAVAEALFGDLNPAGRLPVTFYQSTADLPAFEDYSMSNRTYRYFSGTPEFAFGHGLSYTRFHYRGADLNLTNVDANGTVRLTFMLENAGARDGEEVAQVYFRRATPGLFRGRLALCGFSRVLVPGSGTKTVSIQIPMERFRCWSIARKQYVVEPGDYELLLGAASDDIRLRLPLRILASAVPSQR